MNPVIPLKHGPFEYIRSLLARHKTVTLVEQGGNGTDGSITLTVRDAAAEDASRRVEADPQFRRALLEAERGEFVSVTDDAELVALLKRDCPEAVPILESELVDGGAQMRQAFEEAAHGEFVSVIDYPELLALLRRDCPELVPLLESEFIDGGPEMQRAFREAAKGEFVCVTDDPELVDLLKRDCP